MLININNLKDGKTEKINKTLPPNFLEIKENDLLFDKPITIKGEAYLAQKDLIIHLKIEAYASIPCSICNKFTYVSIFIDSFYHTVQEKDLDSSYDYKEPLRNAILLEVPSFAECNNNKCPEREKIKPYLSKEKHNLPFKELENN